MKRSILFIMLVLFTGIIVSTANAVDIGNGFNLSNTTYLDYTYATGDHFDSNNPNFKTSAETNKGLADGFHFTRVYLTLKKQVNDELIIRITTDQMTNRQDGSSEASPWGLSGYGGPGRGNLFIKYVYGEYTLNPALIIRFGLTQTPWIDEAENRWTLRFLRPTYWDEQGALTSSDLGVSLLGGVLDKMITYHLMFSNGEGYENNNVNGQGNSAQGRVDLNLRGFTFSVFGMSESAVGTSSAVSGWNEDREIFYLMYADPMFRISAEFMMANDELNGPVTNPTTATSTSLASFSTGTPRYSLGRGMGAWAWTKIPGFEASKVFARYYSMTPNSANDVGKMTEFNVGLSYDVTTGFTVALDDTRISQSLYQTSSASIQSFNDNVVGVRAQLSF
jgi:hypothetical protein